MATFFVAAAALTLLAMGAVLAGARPRREQRTVSRAATNAAVLRQQLAELEAERARGLLDEAEFARARDELRLRLLADLDAPPAAAAIPRSPRRALLVYALLLPVAAAVLYGSFGNPAMLGAPAGDGQWRGDPAAVDQRGATPARLEKHLASSPGDARAWVMLGRARMELDQFDAAAQAYAKALQASSRVAQDPLVWCEYADALGMAQGGRLAGRPRESIDKALALDGTHPRALEMAGSAAYEAADFHGAARYWRQLLAQLPSTSEEHAQLAAAIGRAEQKARAAPPGS